MIYQDIQQCSNMKQYALRKIGHAFTADICYIVAGVILGVIMVTGISVIAVVSASRAANCVHPSMDVSRASVDVEKVLNVSKSLNNPVTISGTANTTHEDGGDQVPTIIRVSVPVIVEGVDKDLTHTGGTPATRPDYLQFLRQLEELSAVGCRPTRQVITVMTLLKPEDDLLDKISNPQWVVVGRCLPTCSYCGSGHLCLPAPGSERMKMFIVYVRGDDHKPVFHTRYVMEHTSCSCQPL
ncbi:uncharacterized protein [Panulirus ornatus]|uniref:uncharacterized protein n=1 Tax=Panulirus ornatus TaxID=150431 RepID=UPI003A85CE38